MEKRENHDNAAQGMSSRSVSESSIEVGHKEPPLVEGISLGWTDLLGKAYCSRKGKDDLDQIGILHRLHLKEGKFKFDIVSPPSKGSANKILALNSAPDTNETSKNVHFKHIDEELPDGLLMRSNSNINAQIVDKKERIFADDSSIVEATNVAGISSKIISLTFQPRIRFTTRGDEEPVHAFMNTLDEELLECIDDDGFAKPKFFTPENYEKMILIMHGDVVVTKVDIGFMLFVTLRTWPGSRKKLIVKQFGGVKFDMELDVHTTTTQEINESILRWAKESGANPASWVPIRVVASPIREFSQVIEKKRELVAVIETYKEHENANCDPLVTPRSRHYERYFHEESMLDAQRRKENYSYSILKMDEEVKRMRRDAKALLKRMQEIRDAEADEIKQKDRVEQEKSCWISSF